MSTTGTRVAIRPARPGDAESLAVIYRASSEHHFRLDPSLYTPPAVDELVERYKARLPLPKDQEILVAEVEGEVVGWLEIVLKRGGGRPGMLRDQDSAEIDIAVDPDHRSSGVGSELIRAAEAWTLEHGAELMTVEVHVANLDAIRFYQERHGWRTTGLVLMKRPERPE